ncbi:MAG TPA: TadE family protein [Verrucomicrobiae bacterium]|nr:TadE family protein [Verrucomicrobiae bacterium]
MVEFAVFLPMFVFLLVGLIEIGRFANFSIVVANAARAGVQYGAQNLITAGDSAGMQKTALADGGNISGLTAVATHYCQCSDGSASTCAAADCSLSHRVLWVKVTTTGTFSSLLSYPGLPGTFNVQQTAIRRVGD